jgi:ribosomal protein L37AE/L43A
MNDDEEKYKLLKQKYRAEHYMGYRCPACGGLMRCQNIFNVPFSWWICDTCKAKFELCFRKIEPKV